MQDVAAEEADAAPLAAALAARAGEEPALPDHLHWIWRAWWRLSDDRPWSGGEMAAPMPRRIPWTAVNAWCLRRGYDDDQEDALEAGLAALDDEYLAWHAEERRRADARRPRA